MSLRELNLRNCKEISGDVTPKVVRWISGLFQNNGADDIYIQDCGPLVLKGDMKAEIDDIAHIQFSNMNTLTGR